MPGPFNRFTTTRLVAERLTPDLMPEVFSQNRDERVMAFIGGTIDEARTLERYKNAFQHWDEHGYGVWLLRDRETNAVVGRAVLRHFEVNGVDELELGYLFRESHWGRGLGTEIAQALVDLARREIGRQALVAFTDPRNDASRHVLEKVGFALAGTHMIDGEELNLFRARWPEGDGADGRPAGGTPAPPH
jgi:RimJ/RimL family protein N-acetyltransferase